MNRPGPLITHARSLLRSLAPATLAAWAAIASSLPHLSLLPATAADSTNTHPVAASTPSAAATTTPTNAATSTATPANASTTDTNTPAAPTTTPSTASRDSESRTSRSDRSDRSDRRPSRRRDRDRGESETPANPGSDSSTNQTASGTDFASFKIIADRNIFNPGRGRGSGRGERETPRRPVQVDLVTLVGALSYAKGDFAFFDGSSSQFRQTLKCGDTVAGYTIKSIRPNLVHLEAGEKSVDMPVGSQFRREDEGEWRFIARADATALAASTGSGSTPGSTPTSTSSSGASSPGAPATGASGGGADDILQRLMRKREQEK